MDELYQIQNVLYNATGCTLKANEKIIDLTAQQNRLLRCLVLNAGHTLTKEQIIEHVWGYNADSNSSRLIYDTVSNVRRLLKKAGLDRCIATKTDVGYVFTERVEKVEVENGKPKQKNSDIEKASETVHIPPAFAEDKPKLTLDTVYLLLMGDSMYKKAWFLQSVGCTAKLPPLCLEPGSADTAAEDAFFRWILPESVWARILLSCPEENDRKALYGGEGSTALLSDLKQDFQNDSGWRGRELTRHCQTYLERMLIPSVIETTLGTVLQNSPQLRDLYRLWQRCSEENNVHRGVALVVLCALLGKRNFKMLAETRNVIEMLNENF